MNTDNKEIINKKDFLERDLSEKIVGACINVSNTLGIGFLESVYHNSLLIELDSLEIPYTSQTKLQVRYKGIIVGEFIADIVIDNKIILELKVAKSISNEMIAQLMNYLKISEIKIGYVINFGNSKLEWKRVIL